MPFKLTIEADNINIAQAALLGVTRALAEETGPEVLSDQASSDIVQQTELPLQQPVLVPEAVTVAGTRFEIEQAPEPKKRGRKPKLVTVPAVIEDVEPPPEVTTEEDEPEAEGAVDTPEPAPPIGHVSEAELREVVREIMDSKGIPAALAELAKAGYKQVKDIPPADYARVHAILVAKG